MTLLTVFSLVAAGCGSSESGASSQNQATNGDWVLDILVLEGDMAIPLPDGALNLRINGTEFGGDAGCNSMGGSAVFSDDGGLEIRELFWTEMACADSSLMDFEQQYTQAVSAVTSWSLDGERLTLSGDGVEAAYVPRVAPPDLAIVDTVWTLDTFFDGDSAMNAAGMDDVQIVFSAAGVQVSGRCWELPGLATIEPGGEGNLAIDFTTADPAFSCDDSAFLDEMVERLSATNEYRITESRLWLGNSGTDLISLRG